MISEHFCPSFFGPSLRTALSLFSLSYLLVKSGSFAWSCELLLGTNLAQETVEDSAGKLYCVVRYDYFRDPIPCDYAFPESFFKRFDRCAAQRH